LWHHSVAASERLLGGPSAKVVDRRCRRPASAMRPVARRPAANVRIHGAEPRPRPGEAFRRGSDRALSCRSSRVAARSRSRVADAESWRTPGYVLLLSPDAQVLFAARAGRLPGHARSAAGRLARGAAPEHRVRRGTLAHGMGATTAEFNIDASAVSDQIRLSRSTVRRHAASSMVAEHCGDRWATEVFGRRRCMAG
jgi:hypothetical protein